MNVTVVLLFALAGITTGSLIGSIPFSVDVRVLAVLAALAAVFAALAVAAT